MKLRKGSWCAEFTIGGNVEIYAIHGSTPVPRCVVGKVVEAADVADLSKLLEAASYKGARAVEAACELYSIKVCVRDE